MYLNMVHSNLTNFPGLSIHLFSANRLHTSPIKIATHNTEISRDYIYLQSVSPVVLPQKLLQRHYNVSQQMLLPKEFALISLSRDTCLGPILSWEITITVESLSFVPHSSYPADLRIVSFSPELSRKLSHSYLILYQGILLSCHFIRL